MRRLRDAGIDCHFTMGGHYPEPELSGDARLAPELDSVVRFEGEITLLELADAAAPGRDWRKIAGDRLPRRRRPSPSPPRPLVRIWTTCLPGRGLQAGGRCSGRSAMPLLASRGCARTCSFCSIHTFYRAAPGKVVRTRKPGGGGRARWPAPRRARHRHLPVPGRRLPALRPGWRRLGGGVRGGAAPGRSAGRVIWKINCRADVVEPEIFARMRDAGLYLVYMGLESGSEEGLRDAATSRSPSSRTSGGRDAEVARPALRVRVHDVRSRVDASTRSATTSTSSATIVGDGSARRVFCKMLPYDGTPIKDALAGRGRLRGDVCDPDYDFLDPRMDAYYAALTRMVDVTGWIHGTAALSPQLNWAWNELAILERAVPRPARRRGLSDGAGEADGRGQCAALRRRRGAGAAARDRPGPRAGGGIRCAATPRPRPHGSCACATASSAAMPRR